MSKWVETKKFNMEDKYLALKANKNVKEVATYKIRLVGDFLKFYQHFLPSGRKFCLKTLLSATVPSETNPSGKERVYKKKLPDGTLVDYTKEDVEKCPVCINNEGDPTTRYAINAINLEEYKDKKDDCPVRIMEFNKSVFDGIIFAQNEYNIDPTDIENGPVFIVTISYKKKLNPTNKDIEYNVDVLKNKDGNPFNFSLRSNWNNIKSKMHDLAHEYNPFRPGKQCPFDFSREEDKNYAADAAGITGFNGSITGSEPKKNTEQNAYTSNDNDSVGSLFQEREEKKEIKKESQASSDLSFSMDDIVEERPSSGSSKKEELSSSDDIDSILNSLTP
jgi:hypothetical protein